MSIIENLCGESLPGSSSRGRSFLYPERPFELPFELNSAGYHYVSSHDYNWSGVNRTGKNRVLLQYTLSGCGALEFEGQTMPVPPGSMMLLLLPEKHRYFLPPESRFWEVRFVNFGGQAAVDLVSSLRRRFGVVVRIPPSGSVVRRMTALADEPAPPTVWEAASAGMTLLTELGRELELHDFRCPRPSFITAALEYCRAHIEEPLQVEKIAFHCGLSRWYFSREFKRNLKMTLPQYMLQLRTGLACELLRGTHLSVKEIADRCGFENPAYFIRCFRRSRGITPGEYRKK